MRVRSSAAVAPYVHMQSGTDRRLEVDAARDRNARQAVARSAVQQHGPAAAPGHDGSSRTRRRRHRPLARATRRPGAPAGPLHRSRRPRDCSAGRRGTGPDRGRRASARAPRASPTSGPRSRAGSVRSSRRRRATAPPARSRCPSPPHRPRAVCSPARGGARRRARPANISGPGIWPGGRAGGAVAVLQRDDPRARDAQDRSFRR